MYLVCICDVIALYLFVSECVTCVVCFVCVYVCACVRMCVCECVRARMRKFLRVSVNV